MSTVNPQEAITNKAEYYDLSTCEVNAGGLRLVWSVSLAKWRIMESDHVVQSGSVGPDDEIEPIARQALFQKLSETKAQKPFDLLTQIKFRYWICNLRFGTYSNGRVALMLVGAAGFEDEGEPIAKCTVNLPDEPLEEGHVFIKDWNENVNMLDTLVQAGIVSPAISVVLTGGNPAFKCKLLIQVP